MAREFLTPVVLPADPVAPMEASTRRFADEVHIGDTDPYLAEPTGKWELWVAPLKPFVISICPPDSVPPIEHAGAVGGAYGRVTMRIGGLIPAAVYACTVSAGGSFDTGDIQVADANGEAAWVATAGLSGTYLYEIHDGTTADPVILSHPVTFAGWNSTSGGLAFTVGVPGPFGVEGGPIVEGERYLLEMEGAGMVGATVNLPLTQTAGPTGVEWQITPAVTGAYTVRVSAFDPCGSNPVVQQSGTVT